MAWRAIQDTVGSSTTLASIDADTERLYWRLLAHSDSHGRLDGDIRKVRAVCIPLLTDVTDAELAESLIALEKVGRILLYETDGRLVILIADFEDNQPPELLRKRGKSRLPDPPEDSGLRTERSGLRTDLAPRAYGTFCKTPANGHHSRTTPTLGRTTPGQSRVEESRYLTSSSSSTEDAAPEHDDDERNLRNELEALGWYPEWIERGLAEPGRARAWILRAKLDGVDNPGAVSRTNFAAGGWPSEPATPKTDKVDVPNACRQRVYGRGWDEATDWTSMREEFERLETKHNQKLTAPQLDELHELWQRERELRYAQQPDEDPAAERNAA